MTKISTFDDWTDYFHQWQRDIGLDTSKFDDYKFEVKFGAVPSDVIEFGDYAGRPKWETVLQIPDQRVRDTLLQTVAKNQRQSMFDRTQTPVGGKRRSESARLLAT